MEEKMTPINIENIMQEIRESIKSRNYENSNLSFEDIEMQDMESVVFTVSAFDLEELEQNVKFANARCNVQAYRYLSSHRPVIGKVVTFIKKIIRKSCKFYIEPIVEDQNGFNISMARTCNQLLAYVKETQRINEELKNRLEKLEKEIKETQ